MSIQAVAWVLDNSEARGVDRLVLIVLANHYNAETGRCDPGQRRIADEARIDQSTVARSVARLVELGELEVVRGTGQATTKYRFPWFVERPRDNSPSDAERITTPSDARRSDARRPRSDAFGTNRNLPHGRIETINQLTKGDDKTPLPVNNPAVAAAAIAEARAAMGRPREENAP